VRGAVEADARGGCLFHNVVKFKRGYKIGLHDL